MRILGVDFGSKRTGLALCDPLGYTAQALQTAEESSAERLAQKLAVICRENAVSEIVVGLPVNMDGSLGPKAKETMAFVARLESAAGIPVKTWDERLSTRQVDRILLEGGASRAKRKQKSDALAAVLILQSYLDSKRGSTV